MLLLKNYIQQVVERYSDLVSGLEDILVQIRTKRKQDKATLAEYASQGAVLPSEMPKGYTPFVMYQENTNPTSTLSNKQQYLLKEPICAAGVLYTMTKANGEQVQGGGGAGGGSKGEDLG